MGKNIGKNIIKYLSDKYSQKHFWSCWRVIKNTVEATGNLIGNEISNKVIHVYSNTTLYSNKLYMAFYISKIQKFILTQHFILINQN